ncbi:methionyl-tRNA formyltransferase, mitochondrial isoform X2 [Eurosta solidaginis]|uniref:methionyl-tRNA formyltransferase, mitochondrial isoform X2 n=1 Tax=Eurosta solidaginis TaxID=178769 RepID=UPI0035308415
MFCNFYYKINAFKYRRKICETLSGIYNSTRYECAKATSPRLASNTRLKLLFFGTDTFSLPSLQALHKNTGKGGLGVVTSFKNPANAVRGYAELHKLPLHRWPVLPEACQEYDLGVVVSFGHMIPERVIRAFPMGMINVHASLLPRWRGAAPIIHAIMNGDKQTGVSIMRIEPKHFDVGDVLAQREIVIKNDILMPELHSQLAEEGADLLIYSIDNFISCLESATKQNGSYATYAPKITSAITEVNWSQISAEQLYRRFRALFGFKHLNTIFQKKAVQLISVKLPDKESADGPLANAECGRFLYDRNRCCLLVRCAENSIVEVHQIRIEGKKIMSAMDFNNGFLKKMNSTLDFSFTTK